MQHDDGAFGIGPDSRRVLREQAHLITAIQDQRAAMLKDVGAAAPRDGTTQRKAGQNGLHMRIAQPPRRLEARLPGIFQGGFHDGPQRTWISMRLLAPAARFQSPAVSISVTGG